jgi:hypothetical protein
MVALDGVTYHIDDPKLADGLKATISAYENEQTEPGTGPHLAHRDRINLDRDSEREKFAQKAGTNPAHLNDVRDRILDLLTPVARPADETLEPAPPDVVEQALALLDDPALLTRFGQTIRAGGYAGDLIQPKLLYLALTSRLTSRPANVLIGGPSSAGKTFLMESVAAFFPGAATYDIGAMSERALVYTEADFQHRHLLISEAAAIHRDGIGALIVRSVIWGNCLEYEITEQDADGVWRTRRISKPGPTGLITTSVKGIESELETRILTITVPDDEQTTRAILTTRGERAAGERAEDPDARPWHEAQRWLAEEGKHEVTTPFATRLAALFPAKLVRARRDFEQLITLIEASAILHQRQRQCDEQGRIIATEADYRLVYELASPVFGAAAAEGVTPAIRETVAKVAHLTKDSDGATVSNHEVAAALNLSKGAVSRRVSLALKGGFLVNEESVKGKPSKLHIGDPLPDEATLPTPDTIFGAPTRGDSIRTLEHPPGFLHNHAESTVRMGDSNTLTVRFEHLPRSNGAVEQPFPHNGAEIQELFECSHGFAGGGQPSISRRTETPGDAVIETANHLAELTADELRAYRADVESAHADDPHLRHDREALAVFDAMRATGANA